MDPGVSVVLKRLSLIDIYDDSIKNNAPPLNLANELITVTLFKLKLVTRFA